MSVIAKMNVQAARDFGNGGLVELSCICANDLMTAYAESHEDKLFTKYSPWGEARLHLQAGVSLPMVGDQFYLMVLTPDEVDGKAHVAAQYACPIQIMGVTDRGEGAAKMVEFTGGMSPRGVANFSWKMSVDNPAATDQFKPGTSGYELGFYPVSKFDRDEAIAAAHSPVDTGGAAAQAEIEDPVDA